MAGASLSPGATRLLTLIRNLRVGKTSSSDDIRPMPLPGKQRLFHPVAVAEAERPKLRHGLLTGDAAAIGTTVQHPVVKDGKSAIDGEVDVDLDNICTCLEVGLHGGLSRKAKPRQRSGDLTSRSCRQAREPENLSHIHPLLVRASIRTLMLSSEFATAMA